ncbi:hypothetical protein L484_007371 [Morus notabilis]|uniref:Uncharacterized protein n=1 Tax=Morus notabilis TaxID=981085 RepID=W9SBV1_9ROSA|nr:hypothetical protein L484_007371 [Morus notabilis]
MMEGKRFQKKSFKRVTKEGRKVYACKALRRDAIRGESGTGTQFESKRPSQGSLHSHAPKSILLLFCCPIVADVSNFDLTLPAVRSVR